MRISYKYLGRYKEIAGVLIKYGFGFIVDRLNKDSISAKVVGHGPSIKSKSMTTAQRLKCALEELGPTYIKIGQILSTRKDIFDDEIIGELSKLRDDVEMFDNDIAMAILEEELGCHKDQVFSYISQDPIAAASIGQVYEARLLDGRKVVIKIQRPGIESTIKADISILKNIGSSLNSIKKDFNLDVEELIKEMEIQLLRELDYKFESVNGVKLRKIFKNSSEIFIPEIFSDYTSKKILVMEKVEGICLSELDQYNLDDQEKKRIVDIGVRSFFRQAMTCGFFHADPHPGNMYILEDGRLAYIDFGMIGLIDDKTLGFLNQLIIASTNKNIDKIVRVLTDMDAMSVDINTEALRRDLLYLIHYYYDIPFDRLSITDILDEVFRFMRNHKIKLPSQLIILGKTVITLEGTSRGMYKDFSVESIANSYLKYYREEKVDLKRNLLRFKSNMDEYYYEWITVPGQIKTILSILEKNNMKLEIGELKSPSLDNSIKKFTTQMSMSIMLAACIVGSSLILASSNIQNSGMIRYVSIMGFMISFVIGITLVFLIFRNNYHDKK